MAVAIITVIYDADRQVRAVVKREPEGLSSVTHPVTAFYRVFAGSRVAPSQIDFDAATQQLLLVTDIERSPFLTPQQKRDAQDLVLTSGALDTLSMLTVRDAPSGVPAGVISRVGDASGAGSYVTVIYYIDP